MTTARTIRLQDDDSVRGDLFPACTPRRGGTLKFKNCWILSSDRVRLEDREFGICSLPPIERSRLQGMAFRLLAAIVASALIGSPGVRAEERSSVTFERDVEPILTRAGCNAGACHGKARGQNGFALSLLGFDPDFDYDGDREGSQAAGGSRP